MRRWLAKVSISGKLLAMTLLVASLGILSGGIVMLVQHRNLVRGEVERSAMTLASSAAEYCVGPLVFEDRQGAQEVLDKLRADPRIHTARLFDDDGGVYAAYAVPGHEVSVGPGLAPGIHPREGYLLAVQGVSHEGRRVGTLVIATSTTALDREVVRQTAFTLALCVGLIAACGLLAARLQKSVTAPLIKLAETMRGVARNGGLPARVDPPTSDEVGTLYEGFNAMVAELQARVLARDRIEMSLRALLAALPDQVFVVDGNGMLHDVHIPDPANSVGAGHALAGRPLEESLPVDVADALLALVRETLATGQPQRLEYSLAVGEGTRSFEAVSAVVATAGTEEANPRVLIISRDVSERRDLERQLRHASKMDAVGRLAGGIAHDFNNLLTGIIGYADLLRRLKDPRTDAYAEPILEASNRAAALVRQLLTFSRRSEASFEPVDVQALVENVAGILRHTVDRRIDVRVEASAVPAVRADPAELESAILNLGINARDAMPEGGELTLRVRVVEVGEGELGPEGVSLTPGPYVDVSVTDTGTGIEPGLQNRIFEPFFTTKPTGRGTGLGLAAVYGTVKSHSGAISVDSALGRGTRFSILLPSLGVVSLEARAPTANIPPGEGHILVVDDEDFVREVAARILRDSGYRVTEAVDGQDAVEIFEREVDHLDLVILDLVMPRMNGHQVLKVLRRRAPTLPVLLISGHALGVQVGEARREADSFLQKPFRPSELAAEVHRLLSTRRAAGLGLAPTLDGTAVPGAKSGPFSPNQLD